MLASLTREKACGTNTRLNRPKIIAVFGGALLEVRELVVHLLLCLVGNVSVLVVRIKDHFSLLTNPLYLF